MQIRHYHCEIWSTEINQSSLDIFKCREWFYTPRIVCHLNHICRFFICTFEYCIQTDWHPNLIKTYRGDYIHISIDRGDTAAPRTRRVGANGLPDLAFIVLSLCGEGGVHVWFVIARCDVFKSCCGGNGPQWCWWTAKCIVLCAHQQLKGGESRSFVSDRSKI